jgi:phosphoribosylanthranilate isomerase
VRRIVPGVAREIVAALPATCRAVGVFVDRPPAEILSLALDLGLEIVQLHGDEPPEDLLALAELRIVRAFRIGANSDVTRMTEYLERTQILGRAPDAVLVDSSVPGRWGGTGHPVSDHLLERLPPLSRLILAGGLSPENVAARISAVRPWMVDVASGVESAPGRKDHARVAEFIRAARGGR